MGFDEKRTERVFSLTYPLQDRPFSPFDVHFHKRRAPREGRHKVKEVDLLDVHEILWVHRKSAFARNRRAQRFAHWVVVIVLCSEQTDCVGGRANSFGVQMHIGQVTDPI